MQSIEIDGKIITGPKYKLKFGCFELQGATALNTVEKVYIALNKPQGYECSGDIHHFSVFDLFDDVLFESVFSVWSFRSRHHRFIAPLTDDGQFLARWHTLKHVAKVYRMQTPTLVTG